MKERLWLLVLVVLLALAGSVAAQDSAPSSPTSSGAVVESGTASVPLSSGDVVMTWWQIIGGFVGAFMAGGVVGVAGLGALVGRLRQDKLLMSSIEKLATSLPSDTLYQVRQLIMLGKDAFTLADEVTDGKPNKAPPGPTLSEVATQAYGPAPDGQVDWLKAPDAPSPSN